MGQQEIPTTTLQSYEYRKKRKASSVQCNYIIAASYSCHSAEIVFFLGVVHVRVVHQDGPWTRGQCFVHHLKKQFTLHFRFFSQRHLDKGRIPLIRKALAVTFPTPQAQKIVKLPEVCSGRRRAGGGGILKFRFDRRITLTI